MKALMLMFVIGVALLLIFYPKKSGGSVSFHQRFIEGGYSKPANISLDLSDVDKVFNEVFSALPETITVYPTENYYYFVLGANGKEIWGNIHFPPASEIGDRLDFAYWRFEEDPKNSGPEDAHYKSFGPEDGLAIGKISDLSVSADYNGKKVIFHFNPIEQILPVNFPLRSGEIFLQRTFDESGLRFLLIFNKNEKRFVFGLDESVSLPEKLVDKGENVWIGERSGFAFYQEQGRKILFSVRAENVQRNNYYDGPFDQLADNFISGRGLQPYLEAVYPYSEGRIDRFGRFTDADHSRMAITPYNFYYKPTELFAIIKKCKGDSLESCITNDFKKNSS